MGTSTSLCAGARTTEDEDRIKGHTADGKDHPRIYDPMTYTESMEDCFESHLNQALFLLASPVAADRVCGALIVDTLTDEEICAGMFFWVLHLRFCKTNDYAQAIKGSFLSSTNSWIGLPKGIQEATMALIPLPPTPPPDGADFDRLLKILVQRSLKSREVFHRFYFGLKCETSVGDAESDGIQAILDELVAAVQAGGYEERIQMVRSQEAFLDKMTAMSRAHKPSTGSNIGATEFAKRLREDGATWETLRGEWYPTDTYGTVAKSVLEAIHVYPSSCYPIKAQFHVDRVVEGGGVVAVDVDVSVPVADDSSPLPRQTADHTEGGGLRQTKGLIFKIGDDLRQDNFVMCFAQTVHGILQAAQIDVTITTYDIVSLSGQVGAVEEVPRAKSIRQIRDEYSDWALDFLKPSMTTEDDATATMDRLVKSCAGTALFTYILGVGDRHLDNVMMTEDGVIFQVDFGYIFGKDPHVNKYKAPKIRLDECVVHALGGAQSEHFQRMEALCLRGFIALRRASSLLIRAIYHLKHSKLPSLINETKFKKRIDRVKKLLMWGGSKLPEGEDSAILKFQEILDDSRNHVLQPVVELLHQCSTSFNL